MSSILDLFKRHSTAAAQPSPTPPLTAAEKWRLLDEYREAVAKNKRRICRCMHDAEKHYYERVPRPSIPGQPIEMPRYRTPQCDMSDCNCPGFLDREHDE